MEIPESEKEAVAEAKARNRSPSPRVSKSPKGKVLNTTSARFSRLGRHTLTSVTAGLVDVVSRKLFKTEVNEILTPDKIQQLKNATRPNDNSTASETPKVHESTSTHTVTGDGSFGAPSPCPVLPLPPVPKRSGCSNKTVLTSLSSLKGGKTLPSRKLARGLSLPTITEIPPGSPKHLPYRTAELAGKSRARSFARQSTAFTLTSPLFRQGSIRLWRKEMNKLDDDFFDLNAFQMAILGAIYEGSFGVGDEWSYDEDDLDDIEKWFTEMGFYECGTLSNERPERLREEFWTRNTNACPKPNPQPLGCIMDAAKLPLGSELEFRRDFSDTVPPMSCNFERDLEHFLNWETQHTLGL